MTETPKEEMKRMLGCMTGRKKELTKQKLTAMTTALSRHEVTETPKEEMKRMLGCMTGRKKELTKWKLTATTTALSRHEVTEIPKEEMKKQMERWKAKEMDGTMQPTRAWWKEWSLVRKRTPTWEIQGEELLAHLLAQARACMETLEEAR